MQVDDRAPSPILLVLSGPPGAGKSAVAELITQTLEPSVLLHGDAFFESIRRGFVPPWQAGSRRQNETVIAAMTAAALAYIAGGYNVVVDFVLGPWHLDGVVSRARTAAADLHYVVLRPREEVLLARIARRGAEKLPVSAARSLYAQFANLGPLERHARDSSDMSASETAAKLMDELPRGAFRL